MENMHNLEGVWMQIEANISGGCNLRTHAEDLIPIYVPVYAMPNA